MSGCGKTTLVDTLTLSMFGRSLSIDKSNFTKRKLRGLQHGYKRLPVVFDDISRGAFTKYGVDLVKNEYHPGIAEYPGFVLSMNSNEPQSFPDEVTRRCLMIYTATGLPPYDEGLRQRLDDEINDIRDCLTGQFYRRYMSEVMDKLDDNPLPEDWLALSSETLEGILGEATSGKAPNWCKRVTWVDYAEARYDRVRTRLTNLLRESAFAKKEPVDANGWTVEGDKIIVREIRDAFGRSGFSWDDVPNTLKDHETSSPGRTELHLEKVEDFIGMRLRPTPSRWKRPFGFSL